MLRKHATGKKLLEIGCGEGTDAAHLQDIGFEYLGLDLYPDPLTIAKKNNKSSTFIQRDFFETTYTNDFDVVFDRGAFHNLHGVKERQLFGKRVAHTLTKEGVWLNISGAADHRRNDFKHGSVFLRDIINPIEPFLEIVDVRKGQYGLEQARDFVAWFVVFKSRK